MEYVYFIFLIGLVIAGSLTLFAGEPVGFFVTAFGLALIGFPYAFHNSDIAKVDYAARIIKVETDYSEKLRVQLGSLPKVNSSLMNSDTPYASIVTELALSEKRVRDANADILDAEMSIEKRKRFATAFVLWFF
jgi:hypothetical protein